MPIQSEIVVTMVIASLQGHGGHIQAKDRNSVGV